MAPTEELTKCQANEKVINLVVGSAQSSSFQGDLSIGICKTTTNLCIILINTPGYKSLLVKEFNF